MGDITEIYMITTKRHKTQQKNLGNEIKKKKKFKQNISLDHEGGVNENRKTVKKDHQRLLLEGSSQRHQRKTNNKQISNKV